MYLMWLLIMNSVLLMANCCKILMTIQHRTRILSVIYLAPLINCSVIMVFWSLILKVSSPQINSWESVIRIWIKRLLILKCRVLTFPLDLIVLMDLFISHSSIKIILIYSKTILEKIPWVIECNIIINPLEDLMDFKCLRIKAIAPMVISS